MKQITQKQFIELIEEKQENAINAYQFVAQQLSTQEGMFAKALKEERNKAYIDAYQDLICYLNGVEIVPDRIEANKGYFVGGNYPEEKIVSTIPKTKQEELGITQDDLKKMIKKTPITPYIEPKVEPLRDDRFREFERIDKEVYLVKELIDAKSVVFIRFYDNNRERFVVEIWSKSGYVNGKTFIEEARAKAYYDDLVEWWKYWKGRE